MNSKQPRPSRAEGHPSYPAGARENSTQQQHATSHDTLLKEAQGEPVLEPLDRRQGLGIEDDGRRVRVAQYRGDGL